MKEYELIPESKNKPAWWNPHTFGVFEVEGVYFTVITANFTD